MSNFKDKVAIYYLGGFAKVIAEFIQHHLGSISICYVSHWDMSESAQLIGVEVLSFQKFIEQNPMAETPIIIPSDWRVQEVADLCVASQYLNFVDYANYLIPKLIVSQEFENFKDTLAVKGKNIAIKLPKTAVYRKLYKYLPSLLENKGFNVVLFSESKLLDDFEVNYRFVHISDPIIAYAQFYLFDVIISDADLSYVFIKELTETKKIYLPHGWVGLIEQNIDNGFSGFDIFQLMKTNIIDVFDYLYLPTRQVFDFFELACHEYKETHNKTCLIPGGYTSLDLALENITGVQNRDAILYAPGAFTQSNSSSNLQIPFPLGSARIIELLLNNFPNYQIIFRPHPACMDDANLAKIITPILNEFSKFKNFEYDKSTSHSESFSRSALMVSDSSTSAYTFSLSQLRPTVFYLPDMAQDTLMLEMNGKQFHSLRYSVGQVTKTESELLSVIKQCISQPDQQTISLLKLRKSEFFQLGNTFNYLADTIEKISKNEQDLCWKCV